MFWGGKSIRWRRAALVLAAGAVTGVGLATPAAAADPAVATARAGSVYGAVRLEGKGWPIRIGPLALEFSGRTVPAYCIDLNHPVAQNERYQEDSWTEAAVANLPKVQWVLLHGYPEVTGKDLAAAAGVSAGGIDGGRLDQLAYSATQLAVWHFSDGAVLAGNKSFGEAEYPVVAGLYKYLIGNATAQPEPAAQLRIDPATATAAVSAKAGPFTVTGPSGDIRLTVTGGRAVDAAGRPLTTVTNGGTFWLVADSPGQVSVSATAASTQSTGRVFLYQGGKQHRKQKLILAGQVGRQLTADARATIVPQPEETQSPSPSPSASTPQAPPTSPTPSPTPTPTPTAPGDEGGDGDGGADGGSGGGGDLPVTGASLTAGIAAGVMLVGGGVLAVVLVRRRRVRFTA